MSSSFGLSSASGNFHARRSSTAASTLSIGSRRLLTTKNIFLVRTVFARLPLLLRRVTIVLASLVPLPARATQILSMILTARFSLLLRLVAMPISLVERSLLKCRSGSSITRATIKVLPLSRCTTKVAMAEGTELSVPNEQTRLYEREKESHDTQPSQLHTFNLVSECTQSLFYSEPSTHYSTRSLIIRPLVFFFCRWIDLSIVTAPSNTIIPLFVTRLNTVIA